MSRSATGSLLRAWLCAGVAVAALAFPEMALATDLRATLEPPEIRLGDTAELAVLLDGDAGTPRVPHVEGLEIEPSGQSTQIQIANGRVTRSTRFLYTVRPERVGDFTLPALEVVGGSGELLATGPLALRVVPSSASPRVAAPSAPSGSGAADDAAPNAEAAARAPRLELVAPEGDLFVGQLETVTLRLLVPDGIQLAEVAPPRLSGPGFTVSALADDQPRESRELIDGVPTNVFAWTAAISAVKPGTQHLDAALDGVVVVRTPEGRRSGRRGPFDDDFFGGGSLLDRFFGHARQQRVHLEIPQITRTVLSLPEAGRPADFDGAVGAFAFSRGTVPVRAAAGDPVTLTTQVAGRGNFDRVRFAGLDDASDLKTYTPTDRFVKEDPTGTQGRKVFEQLVIPARPGTFTVPEQRFSYFDPQSREYVTRTAPAVPILISGSVAEGSPPPDAADLAPAASALAGTDGVLPLRSDLGTLHRPAPPLFLRPSYLGFLACLGVTLLGVDLVARSRRRVLDPARRRIRSAEENVARSLREMEAALARNDARGFHAAVRRALQARLSLRTGANPEALTAADAEAGLAPHPQLARSVRTLLEEADGYAYAPALPAAEALGRTRTRVLETLRALEALA